MYIYKLKPKNKIILKTNDKTYNGIIIDSNEISKSITILVPKYEQGLERKIKTCLYLGNNGIKEWTNLSIRKLKEHNLFKIVSIKDSINKNKRNDFRIKISKDCKIKINIEDEIFTKNGITVDISNNGIAFVLKEAFTDIELMHNKKIELKDIGLNLSASFKVKRIVELSNGNYFYGCKLYNINNTKELNNYIYKEQVKQIKKEKRE